jgi:hypothetical protein
VVDGRRVLWRGGGGGTWIADLDDDWNVLASRAGAAEGPDPAVWQDWSRSHGNWVTEAARPSAAAVVWVEGQRVHGPGWTIDVDDGIVDDVLIGNQVLFVTTREQLAARDDADGGAEGQGASVRAYA